MKEVWRSIVLPLVFGSLGAFFTLWVYSTWVRRAPEGYQDELVEQGDTCDQDVNAPIEKSHTLKVFERDFVQASKRAMPSVVHVHTMTEVEEASPYRGSIIEFFFGPQPTIRKPVISSGSGVIVTPQGHIITNHHVVRGAHAIEVTLYNQQKYQARVVAQDPATDLALLKVNPMHELDAIEFGDSENLQVGNWVLAIGNPFNLENTVTAGIVSSLARNINLQSGRMAMESLIQVDAAVNPGNSGGALVNMEGKLVGINTAIASPTGTFAGYAFSIPETIVHRFLTEALNEGAPSVRGYLGVHLTEMTPYLARSLNNGKIEGVVVVRVFPDSPAEKAGLSQGDIIVRIDDKRVNSVNELQEAMNKYSAGEVVNVQYRHRGTLYSTTLMLVAEVQEFQQ